MRYATIGTGWITDAFIRGAQAVEGMDLVAVYSRTKERGETFAHLYGTPKVYTRLEDLAADDEIDGVYVASPNHLHVAHSRFLLEHGKHVLCEKPLAAAPEQVEALQKLAKQQGLVYMEAIMMLYQPQLEIFRRAVQALGRISTAQFDFCQLSSHYPSLLEGHLPNVFNPEMETGTLMDLGIYCVYPALYLFGKPESIQAAATLLPSGADGAGSTIWQYPDKQVILTYSKTAQGYAPSQILGDQGSLTVDSISKLEHMVLHRPGEEPKQLWNRVEKPELMGWEAVWFQRFVTQPETYRQTYEENSRLALEVCCCMREIRRQAGIVFPTDREEL